MNNAHQIIDCLDRWLEKNYVRELSAVQAAEILDKAGILRDSKNRPGLPLRKKLRNGEIQHAYQRGSFWVIPYSKGSTVASVNRKGTFSVPENENYRELSASLLDNNNFISVSDLTAVDVLNTPGLYAIRIKNMDSLPTEFSRELKNRNETLLYIGKATRSLRERLWEEELHIQRPATFFRSIGAVLGFCPPKGSLKGKSNQSNYRFSPTDTSKIIKWIEENLLVNFVEQNGNIEDIEKSLIKENRPLINIQGNPQVFSLLIELREKCRTIARS